MTPHVWIEVSIYSFMGFMDGVDITNQIYMCTNCRVLSFNKIKRWPITGIGRLTDDLSQNCDEEFIQQVHNL